MGEFTSPEPPCAVTDGRVESSARGQTGVPDERSHPGNDPVEVPQGQASVRSSDLLLHSTEARPFRASPLSAGNDARQLFE